MDTPVKLSELVLALDFESQECISYYDRQEGRIVAVEESLLHDMEDAEEIDPHALSGWQSEELELANAINDDAEGRFIDTPSKIDFDEYRHMQWFIEELSDQEAAGNLARAIKGKGAYRRFKDAVRVLGLQDAWDMYIDAEMKKFVIEWCSANSVPYEDDMPGLPPEPPK